MALGTIHSYPKISIVNPCSFFFSCRNTSRVDRIYQAATDFRTGRFWPPATIGVSFLWDQVSIALYSRSKKFLTSPSSDFISACLVLYPSGIGQTGLSKMIPTSTQILTTRRSLRRKEVNPRSTLYPSRASAGFPSV